MPGRASELHKVLHDLIGPGVHHLCQRQCGLRQGHAWCFANPNDCNRSQPALLVSPDGIRWRHIPLPDTDEPNDHEVSVHVAEFDGGLAVSHMIGSQPSLSLLRKSSGASPLSTDASPDIGFVVYQPGDLIEPEVDYGLTLYTHCGIDHLGPVDGIAWQLVTQHIPPEDFWQVPGWGGYVYGFMRLTNDGQIEYSVDGTLIATYDPAPNAEQPGCY